MRGLFVMLLWVLVPSLSSAQVVFVEFKEEKTARRYKRNLSVFKGKTVVVGEVKAGITFKDDGGIQYSGGAEAKNELFVADPARPDRVPYKWQKGKKVSSGSKTSIQIAGNDIKKVGFVDRLQTLEGLAADYELRLAEIERLEEERDGHKKGSAEWFNTHGRVLSFYDKLHMWLSNTGYPAAAKKLDKEIGKQRKTIAKEAVAEREAEALASIETLDTPPELTAASEKITDGKVEFFVQESAHVRMTYHGGIPDPRITDALKLAERIIEGFRREFVDPYRDENFKDRIPDKVFVEFYLGPPDDNSYEKFKTEYYGGSWGRHKERSLKMQGTWLRFDGRHVNYWRAGDEKDIDGTVCHGMAHMLAHYHYSNGTQTPAWIQEGTAYYISFGYLGRNTVTCFAFADPSYGKAAGKEGEKTVQRGERGWMNELALMKGTDPGRARGQGSGRDVRRRLRQGVERV